LRSEAGECSPGRTMSKFEKLKLPNYGQMGGVAMHSSEVHAGPRVLVYGGQRQGISGAMYAFEQSSTDGYVLMPDNAEGTGPPPPPRTQHTLTAVSAEDPNSPLFLFAGFVMNVGCANDLWKLSIGLDANSLPVPTWERLEAAGECPIERYGHTSTYIPGKNKIVVFGGQDATTQFNDVHVLDPTAIAWSQPSVSGTPPIVRVKHTATACGPNGLFLFGGFNRAVDVRVMSDAYKLELSGDGGSVSWSAITPDFPAGTKIAPRAQHATAVTADGRFAIIFGGYDGTKCLNDVWVFDLGASTLRQIAIETPAPEPRSRHTVHIINDLLYVFGGYDGAKPTSGDIFTLDVSDPAGMESAGGGEKKDDKKKAEQEDEPDD